VSYIQVTYFREIGMWYLPDNTEMCEKAPKMMKHIESNSKHSISDMCCTNGRYWKNMPTEALARLMDHHKE
jgi:hypothetical protein